MVIVDSINHIFFCSIVLRILTKYCSYEKPVKRRKINWMKAGILESDGVLTVRNSSLAEKGVELNYVLQKNGITGVVNGMDVQEWNPLTDE